MKRKLLLLVLALSALLVPASAQASPSDPGAYGPDITPDGWTEKTWAHFGNWTKGEVSAESWTDLNWPCSGTTDNDQDCMIEDVRGHSLVRKVYKVTRTEIDFTRLGRYPAGVLAVNDTNLNSGTLPVIEHRTPWVQVAQFCGAEDFRTWTRVTFAVRWSDGRLTKGLSLLSDPTENWAGTICQEAAALADMTPAERKAARDQFVGRAHA
jgi:hypothetical protein